MYVLCEAIVMDLSISGGCHQPIHPVPRRSSIRRSEPSSKLRFSRFFSFIPAGARLFCLGMLVLLLTLPCTYRVGAVTFAFNGFKESDVYTVPGSPWTFQSKSHCFYFDPPEASWNKSVPGRFLYPDLVQMKDPVTRRVKSFSTTFIYQIQIQDSDTSSDWATGPGLAFIVVPDNVTVGAALDFMGLFTTDTSTSAKNYESDNHTLGVELDTFMNSEFNDPNANHIGLNLASMNSTFIFRPAFLLARLPVYGYTQIWIDYFEVDSGMDISISPYGEGKPAMPQGSQTGLDLSLLLENMYIGFSTAKGFESDNKPYLYAWSFSNDGIPAPQIVIDLNATSASPPADGPLAAPPEVPSSPSLALASPPLPSPPPISMANPPSFNISEPGPTPTTIPTPKKRKRLNLGQIVGISVVIAAVVTACISTIIMVPRSIVFRRPVHIFISHALGASSKSGKFFPITLNEGMKSLLKSRVKIFLDRDSIEPGVPFATTIIKELARSDIGIVVITKEYFERKWPMVELISFVEAQKNDPRKRIRVLPLFYELTPDQLMSHLREGTWEVHWEEMARGNHPIEVEKCRDAVKWICNARGILYNSHRRDNDKLYIDTVCEEVDKILCKERSLASILRWAKTRVVERVTAMTCIDTEKRRRRANQRARKEMGLMTYINNVLRLLFACSGLLIILLSVILDNSFNDQPVRFTAFAIFAPVTIFLGFLASGWFPRIPLRFIAFVKRRGFLRQVLPCSPWHDNVVTDFCGEVCALGSLEQAEGGTRLFELPMSVQNFLYGDRISPQGSTATATTQSTFHSEIQEFQVATAEQEGQDLPRLTEGREMLDLTPVGGILERSHSEMATSQASSPNLQEAPSPVGDIVVEIDENSTVFHILDNERAPILEFDGPAINGFRLTVQAFKNTSTTDHTFDLSCTFRNKRTKRMYLTTERLQNLVQNMCQWEENPYPIVVDESSGILHCMAIEDILWEFTKTVYTFRPVHVEHRFLAGLGKIKFLIILSYVSLSFLLSLFPLLSDKRSLFFLFSLFALAPYLFVLRDTNPLTLYRFKTLFCPICVKIFGFNRLYKSKSSFTWCNEFRKEKIVNPTHFWIDEEYANTFPDTACCFDVCGFLDLPDSPPNIRSFTVSCQGWPAGRQSQHDYRMKVRFDSVRLIKDVNCYTNVRLQFFDDVYLLGTQNYTAVKVQRVHLVEKLFHCFSNPSFGGYVEKICPTGYCSTTFVADCPRFIDFCETICGSKPVPKLLVASRMPGSKFIVGVPFESSMT